MLPSSLMKAFFIYTIMYQFKLKSKKIINLQINPRNSVILSKASHFKRDPFEAIMARDRGEIRAFGEVEERENPQRKMVKM